MAAGSSAKQYRRPRKPNAAPVRRQWPDDAGRVIERAEAAAVLGYATPRVRYLLAVLRWRLLAVERVVSGLLREFRREAT